MAVPELLRVPTPGMTPLDAAVLLLEIGVRPVPVYGVVPGGGCRCPAGRTCKAPGKHPIGEQWQKRAPSTLDEVRDVFAHHTGNVGMCVADTKYIILDADGELGLSTIEELNPPRTLRARSGSGGAHLVYELTEWQDASEITDRKALPGVDIKKRGQVVVAPSVHISGGHYEFVDAVPIAKLPDSIYQRIKRPSYAAPAPAAPLSESRGDMVERARAYIAKMPPAISGAGGHAATFAVARKLVQDYDFHEHDAWSLLLEYNQRCDPPWSEKELRHKLVSAQKAHTRNPIQDRPRLRPVRHSGSPPPSNDPPDPPGPPPPAGDEWMSQLLWKTTKTGRQVLMSNVHNVSLIIQLHPSWRGKLRYDQFAGRVEVTDPPWSEFQTDAEPITEWSDEDDTRLLAWLEREYHDRALAPSAAMCRSAVEVASRVNGYHPVRDYFDSLQWDGVARIDSWLAKYLGAESNPYATAVGRWWLISGAARVYDPGCKVDHVLILEGHQGIRKSSALAVLAGDWFTDTPIDLNSKDAYGAIQGKLIIELAELDSLFRAENSRAKAFFSSGVDRYRGAYRHRDRDVRRSCIFAGTVNGHEYLRDPTGARRFWPVSCSKIDLDGLRAVRDQLWAEAVALYRLGEHWWPETDEEKAAVAEPQEERTETDPWTGPVAGWLATRVPGVGVTSDEILTQALGLDKQHWNRSAQTRLGSIVTRLGWSKRRDGGGGRQWKYWPT